MTSFKCLLTTLDVNLNNIEIWNKKLKIISFNLSPAHKKILNRYGVKNIEEYKTLIINNLKNNTINSINKEYEKKKNIEMESNLMTEKLKNITKINKSIKKFDNNINIKLLGYEDEEEAIKLYKLFKETMDEEYKDSYVNDFILKNKMFGLFINNILKGFVIIEYNRNFKIDNEPKKVSTFYIQELLIDPNERGKKLSLLLLEYCIIRCPIDQKYISLMTNPSNIALIKVAIKVGFVKNETVSGDKVHSLLMIRNMDAVERNVSSLSPISK